MHEARASSTARADTTCQTLSNQLFVGHRDRGAATEAPVEADFDDLHAVAMSESVVVQIGRVVLAEAHVEIFELDRPARGQPVFDATAGGPADMGLVEVGEVGRINGTVVLKIAAGVLDIGE